MRLTKGFLVPAALAIGLALAGATVVKALILVAKSPAAQQRTDIGKQSTKLTLCMAKATLKCEANGTSNAPECNIVDPDSSTVPDPKGKIIPKYKAALNKCASKLDFSKKSATNDPVTDYTGIGCPGDSDPNTAGNQPFTDLNAYQANVAPNARSQLHLLGAILQAICADNQCTVDQGTLGLAYAKGLLKCVGKCEDDYNNKAGNGGGTDDMTVCTAGSADPNMQACVSSALEKAQKKGTLNATLKSSLEAAVASASNGLYNEDDCP